MMTMRDINKLRQSEQAVTRASYRYYTIAPCCKGHPMQGASTCAACGWSNCSAAGRILGNDE